MTFSIGLAIEYKGIPFDLNISAPTEPELSSKIAEIPSIVNTIKELIDKIVSSNGGKVQ